MTAQYSNKIYTITKVNKNSVMLDNSIKRKKSDILMISDDTQEIAPDVHQVAVRQHNAARNRLIRADVQQENIIHGARERRANIRYL